MCVLIGCHGSGNGGDGGAGSGGGVSLKPNIGLDLAHVVGFAIGSGGQAASRRLGGASDEPWADAADGGTSTSGSHLYAIDDQGNLTITTVLTTTAADGGMSSMNMSMSDVPNQILDSPLFVLFTYQNLVVDGPAGPLQCRGVFMRKADGALFCLSQGPNDASLRIDSDATGNTLFVGARSGLVRIDVSGADPAATTLFDMSMMEGVSAFTANADGDVLLAFDSTTGMTGNSGERVIKKNGGLQNVSAVEALCQWRVSGASSSDFYYLLQSFPPPSNQNTQNVVVQARQSDGSYAATNLTTTTAQVSGGCQVALASTTYAWGTRQMGPTITALVDMFDPGTLHPIAGVATIGNVVGFGSSVFVQGNDSVGNGTIVRVDVPSLAPTTILPAGDFSLSALSVSKTGELSFAGLRNSDGAQVIGNVAAGTTTYTIVNATAPSVTALQRIN